MYPLCRLRSLAKKGSITCYKHQCLSISVAVMDEDLRDKTFPMKLQRILSEPEFHEIISWLPHGLAWKIHRPKMFVDVVMPKYFEKQSKYASFLRQVSGWEFRRVTHGDERNAYYHEFFIRDQPNLVKSMRRKSSKKKKSVSVTDTNPLHQQYNQIIIQSLSASDSIAPLMTVRAGVHLNRILPGQNETLIHRTSASTTSFHHTFPPAVGGPLIHRPIRSNLHNVDYAGQDSMNTNIPTAMAALARENTAIGRPCYDSDLLLNDETADDLKLSPKQGYGAEKEDKEEENEEDEFKKFINSKLNW